MSTEPNRSRARQLAKESFAQGDATGWFDRLYQESEQGITTIPWADMVPNPNLVSWWSSKPGISLQGSTVLVVGCGLGDDAEQLSNWGASVTAFDVAPTAIAAALRRFPATRVNYQVADLLNPPDKWARRFDFVFEAYTLQALPVSIRSAALASLAGFLSSGGALLIIARGREDTDPSGEMPWPLSALELTELERLGLLRITAEDYIESETRRFRVLYRRL